jgi:hypothetical protein
MAQNCLFYTFPNIQNNCQNSRNFIKNNNYLSLIFCINLFSYPFLIAAFFKKLNPDSLSVVNVKNSVEQKFLSYCVYSIRNKARAFFNLYFYESKFCGKIVAQCVLKK